MNQEEKDIVNTIVRTSPLILLTLEDEEALSYANNMLPYSIGIEIECHINPKTWQFRDYDSIPNIMDVNVDASEQRFRIPNGIEGLICLWYITKALEKYSLENDGSGIHYHVDMTDSYDLLTRENVKENEEWILERLDTWNYKGTYNRRKVEFSCSHNWLRFQDTFKTAEFRLGSMTFKYERLIDNILSATEIISGLNYNIGAKINHPIRRDLDVDKILSYEPRSFLSEKEKLEELQQELKDISKEEEPEIEISNEEIEAIIKRRKLI